MINRNDESKKEQQQELYQQNSIEDIDYDIQVPLANSQSFSSDTINQMASNKPATIVASAKATACCVLKTASENGAQVAAVTGHVNFDAEEYDDADPPRELWSKKFDFLMSIIGFSVDLASVWRFPYLCFKNGGGAFLIPYTIMLFVLGLPLFFMELALGQYNQCGAITCWKKICPLLSGVGYAVVLIAFYTDFYYNVIISWGVYYLFESFTKKLPWGSCGNSWNTKDCYEISTLLLSNRSRLNSSNVGLSSLSGNLSNSSKSVALEVNKTAVSSVSISSSEEYFFNRMYKFESGIGIDNLGSLLWENVGCLFIIYIICYFSMWKGVKSSGKVVWFTALFPYVVLIILAVRALFLPGSVKGMEYYLTPNMSLLASPMVWMDAASQVYFSLGPGFGVLLAFSSYNKFNNNFYKDAIITVFVNYISSFVSGAVIFMYLGYMSEVSNKSIKDVAKEGSSLVFIIYPEAISILPVPQFWSIIFFLMLITLGLDSSFGGSEAIITALADEYPILRKRREIFVGALFAFYMFIGIPSCTQGGYYIVELLNNYSAMYSIMLAVLIENIAVAWIYGTDRFCQDIKEMINIYPGKFWIYCWKYITPTCIAFILCMGVSAYEPLSIGRTNDIYTFPAWSNAFGWMIACSSCICIPIVAVYYLLVAKGTLPQRLKESIMPLRDRKSAAAAAARCAREAAAVAAAAASNNEENGELSRMIVASSSSSTNTAKTPVSSTLATKPPKRRRGKDEPPAEDANF